MYYTRTSVGGGADEGSRTTIVIDASPATVIVSVSLIMDTDDMEVVPSGSNVLPPATTTSVGLPSAAPVLASSRIRHHLASWGELIPIAEKRTATITKTRPLRRFALSAGVSVSLDVAADAASAAVPLLSEDGVEGWCCW